MIHYKFVPNIIWLTNVRWNSNPDIYSGFQFLGFMGCFLCEVPRQLQRNQQVADLQSPWNWSSLLLLVTYHIQMRGHPQVLCWLHLSPILENMEHNAYPGARQTGKLEYPQAIIECAYSSVLIKIRLSDHIRPE